MVADIESFTDLKCDECNFEGTSEKELGWHMGKYHGWPGEEKTGEIDMDISCESQGVRYCVICDFEAEDMYDLEAHHWAEHEDVEVVDHNRRKLEEKDNRKEFLEYVTVHKHSIDQTANQIEKNPLNM